MTQHLSVEIMCFKRRVMYVRLGTFKEEKAMVIDQFWGVGRHIMGSQIFDYWYVLFYSIRLEVNC
jgi:hypothetical protein